jgi:predicted PurR-regulated permease PerM
MSQTSPQSSDPRRHIRYACIAAAITLVLLWTLYLVRGPLLLIYVSALFATGLAPLVHTIERRSWAIGKRRLPRGVAILVIYATVIGATACRGGHPPLVRQSQEFWSHLPQAWTPRSEAGVVGLISSDASFGSCWSRPLPEAEMWSPS